MLFRFVVSFRFVSLGPHAGRPLVRYVLLGFRTNVHSMVASHPLGGLVGQAGKVYFCCYSPGRRRRSDPGLSATCPMNMNMNH